MLELRRAPRLRAEPPELDGEQRAAVDHRGPLLRVLGAPGTGKTTVAVELAVARVAAGEVRPDEVLMLTSGRVAAGRLREQVTARLAGTSTQALARTHQAFGFGVLRQAAALRGDPTPRLLSGPEQDVILRDLLEGYASGDVAAPPWPEGVREALSTRGFRAELRDLLMRAVEHGLEADDLARLGHARSRPEWVAGARVLADYDEVTAFSAPGAYDPAWILTAAADLLEDEPEAMGRLAEQVRLVVVDDAQELTSSAARLLRVVAAGVPGLQVALLGDPDCAVETFRGADPRHLAEQWESLTPTGEGRTLVLPTSYRMPPEVAVAATRVTRKIGALGGGRQREVVAAGLPGSVQVHLLRSVAQEATLVAARLRDAHLRVGIPWSELAVVVRGQGRTATLRRVLMAAGVPVAGSATDLPVRDEVAVRPLLALLEVVLDLARGEVGALDPEVAVDALLSPIGGADAVSLRRLRRALRQQELAGGGGRPSDDLLAEALVDPAHLASLGPEGVQARRVATVVAAGVEAAAVVREDDRARWAPGVTAESVLWAMWGASRLAEPWRDLALAGGPAGARADRDLDAVVGLFDAAAKFVDRLPQAGPEEFLTHIRSQDIPGDTLVARSPSGESVTVLTPQAAAGRQWRRVFVAGVQEGVWPDLRLRGSLLGSEHLVDVVTGRDTGVRAAQAAVRYDETRLFHVALTRASEQVVVTAVRSDDEQPSVYLDVVDPDGAGEEGRPFTEVGRAMTLPTLVAELRRRLASGQRKEARGAVPLLVRLAAAGVAGADPDQWWALREVSDDRPVRLPDQQVRVSPSRVERFTQCGLNWLLTTSGGEGPPTSYAQEVGTLVHEVAALGDLDAATLEAELEERWPRLGIGTGWAAERKREEAHQMVRRVAAYFDLARAQGWERLAVEESMRVTLGRAVITGQVDRLEQVDGGLRVVDYKTGSAKPSKADMAEHPQLGAYQVAVEAGAFAGLAAERTSAGAALLQLGKASNVGVTLQPQEALSGAADPQWAADLVARTADGMAESTYTASPGDWCQRCVVRASCPVQPEGRVL